MSTQEIPSQADFRERAKTNDVPIARLIGFGPIRGTDGTFSIFPEVLKPQPSNSR